jgi:hypothetical protein
MLVVAGGVWFFTTALDTVPADQAEATRSFGDARARFGESLPLLEMSERGPVLKRQPPAPVAGPDLKNIQVIAWDPGDEKLVRVTLPFWLMRMTDGPINVSAESAVPGVRLSMTVDELERYGPALLIDHSEEDGSRILIWTE